jgi:outer membrane protein assembly factor BamB
VYTIGAAGLLSCINGADGASIWSQNSLADPATQNILWGMSGSPLVVDDKVIITPGGGVGRSLVAYDAASGDELFQGGDDPAGYASPVRVQLAGQTQFLSFNGAGLRGFDEQGHPLWLHPWLTQGESQRVNVAQPIVVPGLGKAAENVGHVLVSSGYGMGAALLRIAYEGGEWRVTEVWRNRNLKSKMSNFVVHDGYVYGMDNGIMACLDVNTGDRQWKGGRYGHGQILLVGDVMLVQSESGKVVLVEATPQEHRELASLMALGDKTWNHPTLSGNILIVRNDREAAAFELPLRQANDVAHNTTAQP